MATAEGILSDRIQGVLNMNSVAKIRHIVRSFAEEEDGASLAEYLVLMGVIVALLVTAVAFFGDAMATAFSLWGTWIADNSGVPGGCNQGNDKEVGNAC